MSEKSICIENVSKSFIDKQGTPQTIFEDFSINIEAGTFTSILGPSGCGKSTLLRLIGGLLPYDSGQITLCDKPVNKPSERVSFVFQQATLLPWLSVKDNILFPIKHKRGRISEEHREQAEKLLALINLEKDASKLPKQLSGGMQQRVALARALIQNTDVLLMDEPFSALDAMNREKLGFELLNILEETQKTVVFITHSIPEAVLLSDQILVLESQPANILDLIQLGFEKQRTLSTLSDPRFSEYCQRVRNHFY